MQLLHTLLSAAFQRFVEIATSVTEINPDIAELDFIEFHYRLSSIYSLYGAVW